ncbi:Putative tartrate transporter [Paraburkholderia unamae]|uniref:MFS transporter n=1 Tax=Paraburkholderia unamae TaxID=219649 RepID=UPI001CAC776B|nr:MFS transporter [Paraburkholderia unamae]CAG9271610.1 Putative tartrate transporter [Paraburkholderia unamae]
MSAPLPASEHAGHQSIDARAVYARVSRRIMPFLVLSFVVAFLDRVNIGFAQFQMKQDLGFSDAVYGFAAGIFFIGYMLFEVPSNLLLHRIGARRTFSRIMICWGAVSAGMAFTTTPAMLYTMRFLLGLFEAGFFPGIVLYLSYWYPARYRAARTSWIFAAMAAAGVVGGLLAGTIMTRMETVAGLRGWQWLFVLEGVPAIVLGVIALLWLTDSPERARWLSPAERAFLVAQLEEERAARKHDDESHAWGAVLKQPVIYAITFVYFTLCSVTMALNFWLPTLVKEAGAGSLANTGLLTALPFGAGIVAILLVARRSDRLRERRRHYIAPVLAGCAALALLALVRFDITGTLLLLCVAVAGTFSALPVFWSIPHDFLTRRTAAAGLALISSLGSLGSFFSPTLIGWARTATGSMRPALLAIVVLSLVSCVIVQRLLRTPRVPGREVSGPAGTAQAALSE